mmetsp:Transcript_105735/g.309277  ORF Transcript_105735/g.309277 Transcript_105735/m.309277 type:complete len:222 (-) Transcript_105735:1107-1772(-)
MASACASSSSSPSVSGSGALALRSCRQRSLTSVTRLAKAARAAASGRSSSAGFSHEAFSSTSASRKRTFSPAVSMSWLSQVPTPDASASFSAFCKGAVSTRSVFWKMSFSTACLSSLTSSCPLSFSLSSKNCIFMPACSSRHRFNSSRRVLFLSFACSISSNTFSHLLAEVSSSVFRSSCKPSIPRASLARASAESSPSSRCMSSASAPVGGLSAGSGAMV